MTFEGFLSSEIATNSFRNASESIYSASMTSKSTTLRKTYTPNATTAPKYNKNDPKQNPTGSLKRPRTHQQEPQEIPKGATRGPKLVQKRAQEGI